MQTFCKVGNSYINKDIIDNVSSMRVVLSETKIVLSEEEKKQIIENCPYDVEVVEIIKENVRNMDCVCVIEKKFCESYEKFIDRFRKHFDCFCNNNKLQHYHNWLICNHIHNEVYDDITFFKYKIDFNKSYAKLSLEYDKDNVFSFIKYKKSFYKVMWSTLQTNPFEREFDMIFNSKEEAEDWITKNFDIKFLDV